MNFDFLVIFTISFLYFQQKQLKRIRSKVLCFGPHQGHKNRRPTSITNSKNALKDMQIIIYIKCNKKGRLRETPPDLICLSHTVIADISDPILILFNELLARSVLLVNIIYVLISASGKTGEDRAGFVGFCILYGKCNGMRAFDCGNYTLVP